MSEKLRKSVALPDIASLRNQAQRTGSVGIAEAYYARIEAPDGDRLSGINSFLALSRERALAQAAKVDALLQRGVDAGPLAGVPVAVKDVLAMRGSPATAGSKILAGWMPPVRCNGGDQARSCRSGDPGQAELR